MLLFFISGLLHRTVEKQIYITKSLYIGNQTRINVCWEHCFIRIGIFLCYFNGDVFYFSVFFFRQFLHFKLNSGTHANICAHSMQKSVATKQVLNSLHTSARTHFDRDIFVSLKTDRPFIIDMHLHTVNYLLWFHREISASLMHRWISSHFFFVPARMCLKIWLKSRW